MNTSMIEIPRLPAAQLHALELLRGSPLEPPTKSRGGGLRPRQIAPSSALETRQSAEASRSCPLAHCTHSSMASSWEREEQEWEEKGRKGDHNYEDSGIVTVRIVINGTIVI